MFMEGIAAEKLLPQLSSRLLVLPDNQLNDDPENDSQNHPYTQSDHLGSPPSQLQTVGPAR